MTCGRMSQTRLCVRDGRSRSPCPRPSRTVAGPGNSYRGPKVQCLAGRGWGNVASNVPQGHGGCALPRRLPVIGHSPQPLAVPPQVCGCRVPLPRLPGGERCLRPLAVPPSECGSRVPDRGPHARGGGCLRTVDWRVGGSKHVRWRNGGPPGVHRWKRGPPWATGRRGAGACSYVDPNGELGTDWGGRNSRPVVVAKC